ncbi:MAG: sterol desaturase family protein [Chitinophagales bacterium]|nr:sterol desaturase family protein [Chitinophagales bacterium]MDW8418858.1 sterol desaturase family protein [Chitinophagales bacterium]
MPIESDPVIYAVPFFAVLMAIELYINWKEHRHLYHTRDALSSIGMGLGSLVINLVMKALALTAFTYIHTFSKKVFSWDGLGWSWWVWPLILIADDFSFYWHHRLSHEIRLLWAAHVNHHSSQYLNFATALRQSWVEQLYKYVFWSWMPLAGFEPLMILMMISISLIYQYWPHTELIKKMPRWFEFIFNTPSHHRVHHASNIRYLDCNHGGILIIWDRLFGTFSPEREDDKPVYGITKNIHSYNLLHIAFHEYADLWRDVRNAPGIVNKLKYIFMPPGWSHNGPDLRAKTLRRQLKTGI